MQVHVLTVLLLLSWILVQPYYYHYYYNTQCSNDRWWKFWFRFFSQFKGLLRWLDLNKNKKKHIKCSYVYLKHSLTVLCLFQCWQQPVYSWQQVNIWVNVVLRCLHTHFTYRAHFSSYFHFCLSGVSTETVITCDEDQYVQRLSCGMTQH